MKAIEKLKEINKTMSIDEMAEFSDVPYQTLWYMLDGQRKCNLENAVKLTETFELDFKDWE